MGWRFLFLALVGYCAAGHLAGVGDEYPYDGGEVVHTSETSDYSETQTSVCSSTACHNQYVQYNRCFGKCRGCENTCRTYKTQFCSSCVSHSYEYTEVRYKFCKYCRKATISYRERGSSSKGKHVSRDRFGVTHTQYGSRSKSHSGSVTNKNKYGEFYHHYGGGSHSHRHKHHREDVFGNTEDSETKVQRRHSHGRYGRHNKFGEGVQGSYSSSSYEINSRSSKKVCRTRVCEVQYFKVGYSYGRCRGCDASCKRYAVGYCNKSCNRRSHGYCRYCSRSYLRRWVKTGRIVYHHHGHHRHSVCWRRSCRLQYFTRGYCYGRCRGCNSTCKRYAVGYCSKSCHRGSHGYCRYCSRSYLRRWVRRVIAHHHHHHGHHRHSVCWRRSCRLQYFTRGYCYGRCRGCDSTCKRYAVGYCSKSCHRGSHGYCHYCSRSYLRRWVRRVIAHHHHHHHHGHHRHSVCWRRSCRLQFFTRGYCYGRCRGCDSTCKRYAIGYCSKRCYRGRYGFCKYCSRPYLHCHKDAVRAVYNADRLDRNDFLKRYPFNRRRDFSRDIRRKPVHVHHHRVWNQHLPSVSLPQIENIW